MLKSHIKITFRYLQSHKLFTIINLIGLTAGIIVCFFALIYADFELSYDSYNEKAENIYRLVTDVKVPSGTRLESASIPMAPAAADAFGEITAYARVFLDYMIVQSNPENYTREDVAYADASFFSLFTLPLINGSPKHVLNTPFDVVLSESAAHKYFGTPDCVGQQLTLDGSTKVNVVAVMKDMPLNSHFRTDIVLSLSLLTEVWNPSRRSNWNAFGCYTYLELPQVSDLTSLSRRLTEFVNGHTGLTEIQYEMSLEPLKEVYLYAKPRGYRTGSSQAGNIRNVYSLAVVALIVLFIAVFNFVNLSTAISLGRVKEVGTRKVLGVTKRHLAWQFLLDAVLLSIVAFLMSAIIFALLSPMFNQVVGKQITSGILNHKEHLGGLFLITITIGFLSGIYPALFLSGISPISGLKGKIRSGRGVTFRKALIVTQFFFSVALIVYTMGIYKQLRFMLGKDLGYVVEQKLILDFYFDKTIRDNVEFVREELMKIQGINSVSMSSSVPGNIDRRFNTRIESADGSIQQFEADLYWIDSNFLSQYQIDLVAGRSFRPRSESDRRKTMILNETAVKQLGYDNPNEVIGKQYEQWTRWKGTVIGVVKDFHLYSLKEKIDPLTIQMDPGHFTYMTLEVSGQNVNETINSLKGKWLELGTRRPFSYYFADQAYQEQYKAENRYGRLVLYLATLVVLLSTLGLLALSSLTAAQRSKEISIRKILGASPTALLAVLSKDFLLLVTIAVVIGLPTSIIALESWLASFAYRVELDWQLIASTVLITFAVAGLAIGSQIRKTTFSNPVDSLRQ